MSNGRPHMLEHPITRRRLSAAVFGFLVTLLTVPGLLAPVSGNELLIVQSSGLQPYHEAAEGVFAALDPTAVRQGPKALLPFTVDKVVLDEATDDKTWQQLLSSRRPSVIVAVGKKALELAVKQHDPPVVHVMVPGADQVIGDRRNVSGVSMVVPAEIVLARLRSHHPHIRRIVVLYHPGYSTKFIAGARDAALRQGFELVALPTSAPTEVPRLLNSVTEKVQAVWMIPDPNVLNRETTQIFLDYSLKKRIVLLTFAEKYLKAGATFGVAVDNSEMGREAGRLALHLIEGKNVSPCEPTKHMAYRVFQNTDLLERMADLNAPMGYHLP
jgi:putative tryptophan/tyrosine transport system substrate-binding protein